MKKNAAALTTYSFGPRCRVMQQMDPETEVVKVVQPTKARVVGGGNQAKGKSRKGSKPRVDYTGWTQDGVPDERDEPADRARRKNGQHSPREWFSLTPETLAEFPSICSKDLHLLEPSGLGRIAATAFKLMFQAKAIELVVKEVCYFLLKRKNSDDR